jgi:hypothetical protein
MGAVPRLFEFARLETGTEFAQVLAQGPVVLNVVRVTVRVEGGHFELGKVKGYRAGAQEREIAIEGGPVEAP